jgi:hypothetical protein
MTGKGNPKKLEEGPAAIPLRSPRISSENSLGLVPM